MDSHAKLRDLSAVSTDIGPEQLGDAALAAAHNMPVKDVKAVAMKAYRP